MTLGDSRSGAGTKPTSSGPALGASPTTGLAEAEARVEAHSAALKKELGLRDLVLTQNPRHRRSLLDWRRGEAGSSHAVFWLLALVLFYCRRLLW